MKYKVLINGQLYKVAMSDITDYVVKEDKDVIVYTVDEDNQEIHARIMNPSQHTLYLIEQGKCFLWLDTKMTKKWSKYRGTYTCGPCTRTNWKRGLQRIYHPYWAKTLTHYAQVTDINNIVLDFPIDDYSYHNVWFLNYVADYCQDPPRTEYYFDIKPILVSVGNPDRDIWVTLPNIRSYQTHSRVTRITIQRD